jgi:hypothetical protein
MSSHNTALDSRYLHTLPSSPSADSSQSVRPIGIATTTSPSSKASTTPSAEATIAATVSTGTRIPQDVWQQRLQTAERLARNDPEITYVGARSADDWIWRYGPDSVYYDIRDRCSKMADSPSRQLQMIRFLQLCDEQEFTRDDQQLWLQTARAISKRRASTLLKHFRQDLGYACARRSRFYTQHPNETPRAHTQPSSGAAKDHYPIRCHWKNSESVKNNLIDHLRRLYEMKFGEGAASMEEHEKGSDNKSCFVTLRQHIPDGTVADSGKGVGASERQKALQCLSTKVTSKSGAASSAKNSRLGCSKTVREDQARDLYRQWTSATVSCQSILIAAYAHGCEQGLIEYLKPLLLTLPCKKVQGQSYVTAQGMDVVLGYFVLVLLGEITKPPWSQW